MQIEHVRQLIEVYTYFVLFPLVIVEGVIVTIIAGFLASLGLINLWGVILIAVSADMVSDAFWYSIGRFGGEKFIVRWGRFIGIKIDKLRAFEKKYKKHMGRMLFFGKFLPVIDILSIVAAGVLKVPYGLFFRSVVVPSVPKFAFYAFLGYFFGSFYAQIAKRIDNLTHAVILIFILMTLLLICYKILSMILRKFVKGMFDI